MGSSTQNRTPKRQLELSFGPLSQLPSTTFADPGPSGASQKPRTQTRGGSGARISNGILDDTDHNPDVRGDKWYGAPGKLGIADKMVRDGHVKQSLDVVSKPLRAAVWDLEADSDSPLDQEVADFVYWNLIELCKWDQTLRLALTYMRYGFALLEVTDDVRAIPTARFPLHPGQGSGVLITDFHHRPAWTLRRWGQSAINPAQLDYVEQWIQGSDQETPGKRTIPADRLLRFTCEQEGANFQGVATLRPSYGPWKTKLTEMVLDAIRHERQAIGIPTIELPPEADESEIAKAEQILAELRAHEKGYLILPNGFKFQFTTTDGPGTDLNQAIERSVRDIAFTTASGFQLLGLQGSTGSYALAQTQQGQYQIALDSEAKFLCDTFNKGSDGWSPIRRLVDLNYGENVPAPRLCVRNMPTRDWVKAMPVIYNQMLAGGVRIDAKLRAYIREVMQLPIEDPATMEAVPNSTPSAPTSPGDANGNPASA